MPIIKDKYGAKGSSPRSKFVTRKFNKAIESAPVPVDALSTSQKQADITNLLRISAGTSSAPAAVTSVLAPTAATTIKQSVISGVSFKAVDSVSNILTLKKGESIMDIIISHYHSSSTSSLVGLYWSTTPISDLTFTVNDSEGAFPGIITAIAGGTIYRLLFESIPSGTTLSLASSGMFNTFNNISVDIHLYALCSVLGPELTIIKS
tara:strand:- start:734 stop:1354 length:621 start_codon:yes stop_codon:yes gene_type:complete